MECRRELKSAVMVAQAKEFVIRRTSMQGKSNVAIGKLIATTLAIIAASLILTPCADAQFPGDKAVWGLNGTQAQVTNAHDYIDASVYYTSDICAAIGSALGELLSNAQYAKRGVVDARGIFPPSQSTLTCSQNPWNSNLTS